MADRELPGPPPTIRWDIIAGLIVFVLGAASLYFGMSLRTGVLNQMGPGYVPQSVSYILMGLGILIAVTGFFNAPDTINWPKIRPLFVVLLCPILFAVLIEPAGLVITIIVTASVARFAQPQKFGLEAILVPVLLAAFCVVLFSYLLNLSIPLWPR